MVGIGNSHWSRHGHQWPLRHWHWPLVVIGALRRTLRIISSLTLATLVGWQPLAALAQSLRHWPSIGNKAHIIGHWSVGIWQSALGWSLAIYGVTVRSLVTNTLRAGRLGHYVIGIGLRAAVIGHWSYWVVITTPGCYCRLVILVTNASRYVTVWP